MSSKPLAQKLAIKPGQRVRLLRAPQEVELMLGGLSQGAAVTRTTGVADVILIFVQDRAELETHLPALKTDLAPGGMIWVCYHKGAKGSVTDINRDDIAAYVETIGMRAVSQVAVDADWSALRLKVVDR